MSDWEVTPPFPCVAVGPAMSVVVIAGRGGREAGEWGEGVTDHEQEYNDDRGGGGPMFIHSNAYDGQASSCLSFV